MKNTRNLRRTLLALGLSAMIIAGLLAACGTPYTRDDDPTTLPPAEDTGIVLNLFQPHSAHAALWDTLAADYRSLTGVTLQVHNAGGEALTELKDAFDRDEGAPGLFLFNNPRHYREWREHASDLSNTAAYQQLAERRLALTVEERVVGLPLGVEAFGIIVNTTVVDAYFALEDRESELSSLEEVNTYRELEALVRGLHANREELGIDGVFAAPALAEGESAAWGTRLLSIPVGHEIRSRNLDVTGDEAGELNLHYEAGWRGFHALHHGHITTPENLEERSYADAAREFGTGRAAMILGSTDFLGHLNSVAGQTVTAADITFLPVFMNIESANRQGLAFETTHYAAINGRAAPEEIQAAEDFLNWLVTSERGMDFLVNQLNVIAPFNSVITGMPPQNPLSVSALEWLQSPDTTNTVTWSILNPGEGFRDEVLGAGLRAYHAGERAWDRFRDEVREGWARHFD